LNQLFIQLGQLNVVTVQLLVGSSFGFHLVPQSAKLLLQIFYALLGLSEILRVGFTSHQLGAQLFWPVFL
jgi:hypothetical protein